MALYEIVLAYADREEVRLTDRQPVVGDVLEIGGRSWEVLFERAPADTRATARFLCVLTVSQRERTVAMQQENSTIRILLRELEDRHLRTRRRDRAKDAARSGHVDVFPAEADPSPA